MSDDNGKQWNVIMSKTEYDLKDTMYSAYDTPRKLCNINGN